MYPYPVCNHALFVSNHAMYFILRCSELQLRALLYTVHMIHIIHQTEKSPFHKTLKTFSRASSSSSFPPIAICPRELRSPWKKKKKMNRTYDTSSKRPLKTQYLILYNFISAILWFAVFGRVVILLPIVGYKNVYGGVGEFAKWTQTTALLEIFHSASGKLPTTSLQFLIFFSIEKNCAPQEG